jgi:DNA ligase-1
MQELFPNVRSGYFCYASEITVEAADAQPDSETTLQRLTSFFEEALASSCEGLMGKSLDDDATYMASKRSDSWLKVKRDYVEGLHDTLDLVPIGAWHGNGRKAGWQVTLIL